MNIKEAEKIIITFMDGYYENGQPNYSSWYMWMPEAPAGNIYMPSESLDALIPVWEKLENKMIHSGHGWDENDNYGVTFSIRPEKLERSIVGVMENINEAACVATAMAIKELEK